MRRSRARDRLPRGCGRQAFARRQLRTEGAAGARYAPAPRSSTTNAIASSPKPVTGPRLHVLVFVRTVALPTSSRVWSVCWKMIFSGGPDVLGHASLPLVTTGSARFLPVLARGETRRTKNRFMSWRHGCPAQHLPCPGCSGRMRPAFACDNAACGNRGRR